MDSRTLKLLEFHKVLDLVAQSAVSEPGKEACLGVEPFSDPAQADRAADLFVQAGAWIRDTGFSLSSFPPLAGLFSYVREGRDLLDEDGLMALKVVLAQARAVRSSVAGDKGGLQVIPDDWSDLAEAAMEAEWPETVASGLNRCLSDDGLLRDEASPELMSARREIRRIHRQCTTKVKRFILDNNLSGFLQDEFMTIASDRYVMPLKTNFKGRFQGIIHDYSQTGETCYFEPIFLVELNNELQELKKEEREAEKQILAMLTDLVRRYCPALEAIYEFLVDLDVILAKAAFAEAFDGHKAVFSPNDPLRLKQARHPLLAVAGKDVVPQDIELLAGQQGFIVSGGNAGGKTVCLKTLGLLALMGLSGLPVTADPGSVLPPLGKIFVLLGDEQSIEDHVSTFTAQITHLSRVWPELDGSTLVILDEFGAGTDPAQGAALAQAVVDGLLEHGAHVAAATHFPAMKAYALAKEEIRAASVLFDPKTKKPLFHLAFDQVGASQALDVAQEHGLPAEILDRARNYMLLDGSDTAALVARLNDQAVAREKELKALQAEQERLTIERRKLAERYDREKAALLKEIKAQSQEVVRQWKERKISQKKAAKELAQARGRLADKPADQARDREPVSMETLAKGTAVRYLPWDKPGIVEELDSRRSRIKVDISGVSMWAGLEELAMEAGASARPKARSQGATGKTAAPGISPGLRLDLRGKRADAALSELSRFLDRALLGDHAEVEVLHGKGTGALRREVHDYLRHSPAVREFSLANEEQGGDGLTLVELA